jgi:hypothetical protein
VPGKMKKCHPLALACSNGHCLHPGVVRAGGSFDNKTAVASAATPRPWVGPTARDSSNAASSPGHQPITNDTGARHDNAPEQQSSSAPLGTARPPLLAGAAPPAAASPPAQMMSPQRWSGQGGANTFRQVVSSNCCHGVICKGPRPGHAADQRQQLHPTSVPPT